MAEDAKQSARKYKSLSDDDVSAFCLQMSLMIQSGIPAEEGLRILAEDAADEEERQWLIGMADEQMLGEPLFKAMKEIGNMPSYAVDMVRIGEMTGRLDNVLHGLYEYYKRQDDLKKTVKSAVTYPAVMVAMMAVVVVVLMTKVLPVFEQVFTMLGTTISPLTAALLRLGRAMNGGMVGLVILLVLVIAAVMFLRYTASGQALWLRLKTNCFGMKKLAMDIAMRNFTAAMSMCLASGLDMDDALEMVQQLISYQPFKVRVIRLQELIAEGMGFSDAVTESGVLSGQSARMLAVGFRSGQTDAVMEEIASRYDDAVEERISRMVGIIEPLLVAVLSIAVGVILIAVMLPLMGVMSSMI